MFSTKVSLTHAKRSVATPKRIYACSYSKSSTYNYPIDTQVKLELYSS